MMAAHEAIGGTVVAAVVFAAGFASGSLVRQAPVPADVAALRLEVDQLVAENQRLAWELRQCEEQADLSEGNR